MTPAIQNRCLRVLLPARAVTAGSTQPKIRCRFSKFLSEMVNSGVLISDDTFLMTMYLSTIDARNTSTWKQTLVERTAHPHSTLRLITRALAELLLARLVPSNWAQK